MTSWDEQPVWSSSPTSPAAAVGGPRRTGFEASTVRNSPSLTNPATAVVSPSSSSRRRYAVPQPTPVKDDWEDDEDDEEGEVEEEQPSAEGNKQIWEAANTKVHHPMPKVVVAPSMAVQLPPQALFQQQPTMKILKRPSNSPNSGSAAPSPTPTGETLQERETRYKAARDRIFGGDEAAAASGGGGASNTPVVTQKIVREPLGPGGGSGQGKKGFGGRNKVPPAAAASATAELPI